MNPPSNPHAAEARASIAAHMAQARGEQATTVKQAALYPIDCKLPIVYMECHDDGVWLWWDDPVAMYSAFR